MATTIILHEPETTALLSLAQRTGRSPDELVREAVQHYILQYSLSERQTLLHQARGMWQDRDDLPSLTDLRNELDHRGE